MNNLQKRLLQLQVKNNICKKDIANSIGISSMAYYRYEKGERDIPSSTLIKLADFFDVSLDYLVGRSDNPNSHKK